MLHINQIKKSQQMLEVFKIIFVNFVRKSNQIN
jgi:hypothetical protein